MGVGIGLDPGADSVKIVKVRTGPRGVSILSAARVSRTSGGGFPAAQIARALSAAGIPRRATCGISGRDLMLRYVALPPVPPWRLKMLVDFGAIGTSEDFRAESKCYAVIEDLLDPDPSFTATADPT